MKHTLTLLTALILVSHLALAESGGIEPVHKSAGQVDTSLKLIDPVCLTASPQANDQLLYFTSTSLLADDQHLVFLSDRTGHPNIFLRDLATQQDRQLTFNAEGSLKSYVYFDGQPYRGFGRASVSVDPQRGIVYYLQGRQICAVDTNGARRVLAEYPAGQMTAFTHVSADGTRLCVPTTDARALDGDTQLKGKPGYNIDARVQQENLSSYLRVYDTATGKELLCERVPKVWITHVQFSPRDSRLILYNNEWPADCGIRRMWLWDGKQHIRLRTEGGGRSRSDWTCHEMWERDGSAIIYHGTYTNGPGYIGHINPDGTSLAEIVLPATWKRYGHFTVGRPGWLVTDGCYEQADDPPGSGAWISILHMDWQSKQYDWYPLCRNGSSWKSQDAHPHPIFNHAANAVCFTSDKTGKRAIYQIEVPDALQPAGASAVKINNLPATDQSYRLPASRKTPDER
ncbi:MAG: oligogalacturonate lyase family protein [Verrucomicrobiota bacterium]